MSNITDEVKKQLREIYPEIKLRWTQPGDKEWIEERGVGLRLDWRYKNYEGGCVITKDLIIHDKEAVWACLALVEREISKIERKAGK